MTWAWALPAEAEPVQVVQAALGRDFAAQISRHPSRHLTPVPQAAIRWRSFQCLHQGRQADIVQHRLSTSVTAPAVAQASQSGLVPAPQQFRDPTSGEPRDPRHFRTRITRHQQKDHLKMRPSHPIMFVSVGRHHLVGIGVLSQYFVSIHHGNPTSCGRHRKRITNRKNQSSGIGITSWSPSGKDLFGLNCVHIMEMAP